MAAKGTCGKSDCACGLKSRAFGGATWIAVVVAVGIVGAALYFSVKRQPGSRVAQTANQSAPWKPEPAFLLQHSADLKLTLKQQRHIQEVDRDWQYSKAAFEARLKTYNSDTESAISDIQSGKKQSGELADINKEFDQAREKAWSRASAVLDSEQVMQLDRMRDAKAGDKRVSLLYEGGLSGKGQIVQLYGYSDQGCQLERQFEDALHDYAAAKSTFGVKSPLAKAYHSKVDELDKELKHLPLDARPAQGSARLLPLAPPHSNARQIPLYRSERSSKLIGK